MISANLEVIWVMSDKSDRSLADLERKLARVQGEYFGVDEFHDWNAHVTRLEAELVNRGVNFTTIGLIG